MPLPAFAEGCVFEEDEQVMVDGPNSEGKEANKFSLTNQ
jgi:hypothetical protein